MNMTVINTRLKGVKTKCGYTVRGQRNLEPFPREKPVREKSREIRDER